MRYKFNNPNENPRMVFYSYWQTDYKVCTERQKTQNNQSDIKEKELNWKIDITYFQDVLYTATISKTV